MRYYCHSCHTHISSDELLPEFTCPSCHSGFVEEIPVQGSRRNSNLDESTRSGSDDGLSGFLAGPARMSSDEYSDDNSDVEFLEAVHGPLQQVFELFQPQQSSTPSNNAGQSSQQQSDTNQSDTASNPQARANTRSSSRQLPNRNQAAVHLGASFGTHLPESSTAGSGSGAHSSSGGGPTVSANRGLIDFPLPFFLHSNPGDYAWGNAGFDAVITQLLNNLDGSNSGPPPMPEEQVRNLPTVKISDVQVKKSNLQCTVCMEDFQVDDSARQLPCEHFFHQDCIIPWLNLHASCPICRKTFVTGTNSNNITIISDSPGTTTNVTGAPNSASNTTGATTRSATASTGATTNQTTAPSYDFTEDDCD